MINSSVPNSYIVLDIYKPAVKRSSKLCLNLNNDFIKHAPIYHCGIIVNDQFICTKQLYSIRCL